MLAYMAKKKTETEASKDGHKNQVVSIRPEPQMRDVIEQLAKKERRKLSPMILLLVEEALVARGLWPPSQS